MYLGCGNILKYWSAKIIIIITIIIIIIINIIIIIIIIVILLIPSYRTHKKNMNNI